MPAYQSSRWSRAAASLLFVVSLSAEIRAEQLYATPYLFSTLAGAPSVGSADGAAQQARFHYPSGVTVDGAGNLYVADSGNHTIRKIAPDGTVTTLAGSTTWIPLPLDGSLPNLDGTGAAARFLSLSGLAVDRTGNVFVSDEHTVRKITPAGVVTTFAGRAGSGNWGTADGAGSDARFTGPRGIAVDPAGNLFVADSWNNTIRKITPDGTVSTFAGKAGGYPTVEGSTGSSDGPVSAARFNFPEDVAADAAGNLYVADTHNNTIRKITASGTVTTLAGTPGVVGSADGTGAAAQFNGPDGVAVDVSGNVYVADNFNRTIRKITPAGLVTTLAGTAESYGATDGPGGTALFGNPWGLTVDATGNVFVADSWNNTVRKITPAGVVSTYAGLSLLASSGATDATGTAARFSAPHGSAVDGSGNVYVADSANSTIRKISTTGVVTTLAGLAGTPGSADGSGTAARLGYPRGVAVDSAGNVLVADTGNHLIRKVSPAGAVTTLAGVSGRSGTTDGALTAARFNSPEGVAVDSGGNLYVADSGNHTIRKISATGNVSTLAGAPGNSGAVDGAGSAARFANPSGVAVDAAGNILVADRGNFTIRRITADGVVSTLAGSAGHNGSVDGTGGVVRFDGPEGLAVDPKGNVFVTDNADTSIREITRDGFAIAETGNYRIRRIAADGTVSTLAGLARGSNDGLGSEARFDMPYGVAADAAGNVYVTCSSLDSNTVRKGRPAGPPVISVQPAGQTVTAGAIVQFSVTAAGVPDPTYQWYCNGAAFSGGTGSSLSFSNARSSDAGDYTVVVTNALGSVTSAKATLTVSAASSPPSSGGGSGGGGGGAPSIWFGLSLLALAAFRRFQCTRL